MRIVALAGGVGGAKLADGLARCLLPEDLTVIVNTGDDFQHWGLNISPDLDTVCYTLAGLANPETGWGRIDETWQAFDSIQQLGGDDWFHIGDKDLATHIERTRRLKSGQVLSTIMNDFSRAWGIGPKVIPMSDQPVSTLVETQEQGELAFQEYFVHQRCQPKVKGFRFAGLENALPAPGVLEAIRAADAIVFCPSNPWVSIDPILKIKGIEALIKGKPVLAVSPIIGGQAIKGPAAKMYSELGIEPSAFAVANHYRSLLSGFMLDTIDTSLSAEIQGLGIQTIITNTIMTNLTERQRLGQDVLNFIERSF